MAQVITVTHLVTESDKGRLNRSTPAAGLAKLGTKLRNIVYGRITGVSGASIAVTVPGLAATDVAICSVEKDDTTVATGPVQWVCTTNTLTIAPTAVGGTNDGIITFVAFPSGA